MVYQGQYHRTSGPGPCQENWFSRFNRYVDSCCVGREQPASTPASVSSTIFLDNIMISPLPCTQQELNLFGTLRPLVLLDCVRHIQRAQIRLLRRRQLPNEVRIFSVDFGSPDRGLLKGKLSF